MTPQKKRILLIIGLIIAGLTTLLIWWGVSNGNPSPSAAGNQESSQTSTIQNASGTATSSVASTTAATRASTTPVGHAIGIAAGGELSKLPQNQLNAELDQMVALGVTWVRFDIEWGDVQYSSPTNSTWGSYDTLVAALAAHHLNGLGVITYTPQWARDPSCSNGVECPPADPQTFATFAAEVAARYKNDGMHAWEIWNEPNTGAFWAPQANCAAYADLLKAVYPAIKSADPRATVVTGGTSPAGTDGTNYSPTDFLSCLYANGAGNSFDAVGDHPYTFPAMPSNDNGGAWDQMSVTTPSLRSIMVAHGDADKKIWITEFGTPTDGPNAQWYVSENQQAQMVSNALGLYKTYQWAGPLFWYSLDDAGTSTDTNENFFGLVRADGSTKPAYTVLKNLISAGL